MGRASLCWEQQEGQMMPERIEETTTEARQANGRKMNLRVLVISLVGIVLVFGLVYMVFFATAPAGV